MGKLYFHYSTMNAGKSTALLQANHNYIERGMKTHLLTAKLDDRAGSVGQIHSRIGITQPAEVFDSDTDLLALLASLAIFMRRKLSQEAPLSASVGGLFPAAHS